MAFTDTFVRRPVLAVVVNLVVLIGGLQAIRSLNVRQYPRLESATVAIRTVYVGADAELVRGFITTPIERAVAAADGIDYIESQSVQGLSLINVRLKLNFNPADALADISSRVNQVQAELPAGAEFPAIQIEPSDAAIAAMYLSFGSDILQANQVTDYLIRVVQPRLSAIDGVQRADILGGRTFALRAWLKPTRMAALGVSPADVTRALQQNHVLAAVGETKGALIEANITATTDLRSAEEFRKLIIREQNGALIRLEDVAEVVLGAESYDENVRFSGERAVFMGIWVLPTANSLDVISAVREEMKRIQAELPGGMKAQVAFDSTVYIDDALAEVLKTLTETIFIVILVITVFLGSLRTSLVPVLAIPLSLVGGVFLMQLLGFTLNLLTLLAIVLSVGLVVDDAIVVVENVERRVREGESPFQAALTGARELVRPVVAMTITLAAVYAPIGLQGGLSGALFREFAFTLAGAVLVSGFVALTLSPMMSSKLIRPHRKVGWLARHLDRAFEGLRNAYLRALDVTLGMRPAVYGVWILLSLLIVPMYLLAPKELAPTEDQGVVFGAIEAPANASLEQVSFYTEQVNSLFERMPEFQHSFQLTTPSGGFGGMLVKPWTQRERTIFPIEAELNQQLASVTGIRAPVFLPPPLPSAGTFPVEVVIASTSDHEQLVRFAQQFAQEAAASGEFAFPPLLDVRLDQEKTEVVIDRDKAAALGVNMLEVSANLSAAFSGDFVNRFNLDGRSYKVIPQVERSARLSPSQLTEVYIAGPQGELVPLDAIATLRRKIEPRTLNRFQQLNSVKISGVATRSVDGALQVVENSARQALPPGYRLDYTGESRQLREESGKFLPAMGLALVLIFLVLAAQFNSFRDPFVVLLGSVPLSMFGALIFVFLKFQGPPGLTFGLTEGWTTTLNIYSQVGLVTLVWLISKNGILLVEFANSRQLAGLGKLDAIREGARIRFRPILMTTAATVAGHFPLTLVSGPGAEARNAIGYVLVGGMAIGTLFTLFVVPSIYMLIAREHQAQPAAATGEVLA